MITLFSVQKSTIDNKKEKELIDKQIKAQQKIMEERYKANSLKNQEPAERYQQNRDFQSYIDKDTDIYTPDNKPKTTEPMQQNIGSSDDSMNQPEIANKEKKQKSKYRFSDTNIENTYNIVTDFELDGSNFAIVSKKAEYQSQYSKWINKKYYIYKYKDNSLYEAAYIIDMAIPKDADGNGESKLFTINIDERGNVEIKVNMLNNTTRKYSKQVLLSAPYNKNKMLQIEAITKDETNTNVK
ncbi:MAG: hypothetical protein KHX03_07670 [Clostridium sp.]|nr:hypothetical protein [Clostridium sp.]